MGSIINVLGSIIGAVGGVITATPGAIVESPLQSAAIAVVTAIIGIVAKKADNDKIEKLIQSVIGTPCYAAGVVVTLGLSKWKWSMGLWNKYIEAYFIHLIFHIVNIPIVAVDNFVRGMLSDNNLKRTK